MVQMRNIFWQIWEEPKCQRMAASVNRWQQVHVHNTLLTTLKWTYIVTDEGTARGRKPEQASRIEGRWTDMKVK